MRDLIDRQDAIDVLSVGAELLRRVLDDTDIVGAERAKYEWGLGLIESYISDMKELPSTGVSWMQDKCKIDVSSDIIYKEFIKQLSSAKQTGKWVLIDGYRCSQCNYKLQTTGIPMYCPNCGARMVS